MKNLFGILLHLSRNMWSDKAEADVPYGCSFREDSLSLDQDTWDEVIRYAAECGFNAILIDLGDGIKYKTHPEIAIEGAWETEKLKAALEKIRALGMTPLPKLNFSATHDAWLGKYQRMVGTEPYYQVCKDLIDEVIELFDKPDYFHLGLDEERGEEVYNSNDFTCYRKGKLLWNDIRFYLDCVRKQGVAPWIWADNFLYYPEEFLNRIPKDVILSSWYYYNIYGTDIPGDHPLRNTMKESYKKLAQEGYLQVPCGSNVWRASATDHLMKHVSEVTEGKGICGFLSAPWYPTTREYLMSIKEGLYLAKIARERYEIFQ